MESPSDDSKVSTREALTAPEWQLEVKKKWKNWVSRGPRGRLVLSLEKSCVFNSRIFLGCEMIAKKKKCSNGLKKSDFR